MEGQTSQPVEIIKSKQQCMPVSPLMSQITQPPIAVQLFQGRPPWMLFKDCFSLKIGWHFHTKSFRCKPGLERQCKPIIDGENSMNFAPHKTMDFVEQGAPEQKYDSI